MNSKIKYLLIGKNGQLGKEFVEVFSKNNFNYSAVGSKECDITNIYQLKTLFEEIKPDIVINCAAYNLVDKAEKDEKEAFNVNAYAVKNMAALCAKYKAFFVHYSTDYVFDGTKEGLYKETDKPNPLNKYAQSKLKGEEFLKIETDNYLLFRVSWVYGKGKQNFIYKLLGWSKKQDYLKIAYDEFSIPTSTRTIVDITLKSLDNQITGLFHLTNSGYASRYEWAKTILKAVDIDKFIYPVSGEIFNLPAKRPFFSAMSNRKISNALNNIEISQWDDEVIRYLKNELKII